MTVARCSRILLSFILGLLLLQAFCSAAQAKAVEQDSNDKLWQVLDTGFEQALLPLPQHLAAQNQGAPLAEPQLVLMRVDPERYEFVLLMGSEHGGSRSLNRWVEDFDLVLATNAGMYQKDGSSALGLMHNRKHINNSRRVARLGAFFVSEPLYAGLPRADILDRSAANFQERLGQYGTVLQNFRVIDPTGRRLWSEESSASSLAMLGADKKGRMIFIFSQSPLNPVGALDLLESPAVRKHIQLRSLMYLEGGKEAGLRLRFAGVDRAWIGLPARNLLGLDPALLPSPVLPNVIGVRKLKKSTEGR